jgi:hypothetical protein
MKAVSMKNISVDDIQRSWLKVSDNKECMHPCCTNTPIGSHIIAESILRQISLDDKVFLWSPEIKDMIRNARNDQHWDELYTQPQLVDIKAKTKHAKAKITDITRPLFCSYHDNDVFRSIEEEVFTGRSEQVLLYAYRVLCYKTINVQAYEDFLTLAVLSKRLTQSDKIELLKQMEVLVNIRKECEKILFFQGDYARLQHECFSLPNFRLIMACTDAFIDVDNEEYEKASLGAMPLGLEDNIVFSLLPDKKNNKSICVISWIGQSKLALRFLEKIRRIFIMERQDYLLKYGFTCANVYVSPTWWNSLNQQQQQEYTKLRTRSGKDFNEYRKSYEDTNLI